MVSSISEALASKTLHSTASQTPLASMRPYLATVLSVTLAPGALGHRTSGGPRLRSILQMESQLTSMPFFKTWPGSSL